MEHFDIAALTVDELQEGMSATRELLIDEGAIDRFAALTGDYSPLHMDAAFARSRGFAGRVAHGALIIGYVSRLFGVTLPGRGCLIHSVTMRFVEPVCAGDAVSLTATIDQVSTAVASAVARVAVTRSDRVVAQGKVQFGFTTPRPEWSA